MSTINNVKQLISEGKTKEALDTFQTLLEGSGREEFNESLLLESQYIEVIKKRRKRKSRTINLLSQHSLFLLF